MCMVDRRYSPYPDDNKIIPYSPRKRFGFVSPNSPDIKIIDLDSMKNMHIDQIVELYRNGYRIEDSSPIIKTAQEGIYISTGALLLTFGAITLIYYLKTKGKI